MKKTILIFASCLVLTGCQRGCTSCKRKVQSTELNYSIVMYSGGDTVFYDRFKGIVNNSEASDGVFYYKGDTLIEVSGDYVIKAE